jgi:2',3'-cyclic-nucleotide 2'-phosphodiesterase (5'-nucleotidase family)
MYKRILPGSFWIALLAQIFACQPQPVATTLAPQATSLEISAEIAEDSQTNNLIYPYKQQLEAQMNEIVGYSAKELTKQKVESTLGNFVADLLLEAGQDRWGDSVSLSLVTTGGLRIPLPKGPIRLGTIYELMPFENRVVLTKITGAQLQQLFNYAARNQNVAAANSHFKIRGDEATNITIGGEPLQSEKIYYLSTYDYLAWGGDNMEFMRESEIVDNTDILFRDVILNKFRDLQAKGQPADAEIEGRVVILN